MHICSTSPPEFSLRTMPPRLLLLGQLAYLPTTEYIWDISVDMPKSFDEHKRNSNPARRLEEKSRNSGSWYNKAEKSMAKLRSLLNWLLIDFNFSFLLALCFSRLHMGGAKRYIFNGRQQSTHAIHSTSYTFSIKHAEVISYLSMNLVFDIKPICFFQMDRQFRPSIQRRNTLGYSQCDVTV